MGCCSFKMPEIFLMKVSTLGNKTDEIIPRVLDAGGKIVLAKVKGNLRAVIGKGTKYKSRSTGELVKALGVSRARVNRRGDHDVKVGFSESRSDKKANAMLANILEYGKHGQPAKPFLKTAASASKDACIEAMKSKLREEIDKI